MTNKLKFLSLGFLCLCACQPQFKTEDRPGGPNLGYSGYGEAPKPVPNPTGNQPVPSPGQPNVTAGTPPAVGPVRTQPAAQPVTRRESDDYGDDDDLSNDHSRPGHSKPSSQKPESTDKRKKVSEEIHTKIVKTKKGWVKITWKKTCYYVDKEGKCTKQEHLLPEQPLTNKLDILFITDTSQSFDTEVKEVAQGLDEFIAQLPNNTDLNIGVMAAHSSLSPQNLAGVLYSSVPGEPLVLKSTQLGIPQLRSTLQNKLTTIPKDARQADRGEMGMYSLTQGLKPGNLEKMIAEGMFRKDAALAVVFAADENDICAAYPPGVKPRSDPNKMETPAHARDCAGISAQEIVQKIEKLKGDMPYSINGVIYTQDSRINNNDPKDPWSQENEIGYGYLDMIRLSNGIAVPIRGNISIAEGLAQIGQRMSIKITSQLEFPVDDKDFVDGELHVYSDDVELKSNEYSYNKELHRIHLLNAPKSRVRIEYCRH